MTDDSVEWTSAQMIENASSWSLCGDVALLNRLKQFSKTVISGAEALNTNVDKLLNNLEEINLKLALTKNEFHSLRNTQFIENRVYEDDETLETEEHQADIKQLNDEEKEIALKKSIAKGLEIMEKYYDKVELALSDSEGESNEKSYVMQPKDLYADRPLPYLVGSKEWHQKWHVGLLPSDSESESEPEEEMYSSSNSEIDLPKNRTLVSETSSELDFTNKETDPDGRSTFNNSRGSKRLHSSSESSEKSSSLHSKAPIAKQTFAEQLAEKLGDVVSNQRRKSDVGAQPTTKFAPPRKTGSLFSDKPPPLDELDDVMLPKTARHGLFTADLISESNEANSSWEFQQENVFSDTSKRPDHEKLPPFRSSKVSESKVPAGLFDNLESSSEEDLLAITEKRKFMSTSAVNPYMQPFKATVPFVDDEPPKLITKDEVQVNKKLVENKAILEKTGIPKVGKTDLSKISQAPNNSKVKDIQPVIEKKLSLFDDSSDDEIFAPKPKPVLSAAHTNNLVNQPSKYEVTSPDIDKDLDRPEDILHAVREPTEKVKPKKISLFDDDNDLLEEEEEMFSGIYKRGKLSDDFKETSRKHAKGLFDESDDLDIYIDSSGNKASKEIAKSVIGDAPRASDYSLNFSTKPVGLFDEPNINENDLFSFKQKTEVNQFDTGAVDVNKCNDVARDNAKEASENQTEPLSSNPGLMVEQRLKIDHDSTCDEEEPAKKLVTDMGTNSKTVDLCKSSSDSFRFTDEGRKNVEIIKDVESVLDESKAIQIEHNTPLYHNEDLSEVAIEGTEALNKSQRKFETPPHINLFDPTPPPVDWDASSDNSAESDTFSLSDGMLDRAGYNRVQSTSSVFDEAPPDLPIVEVHNTNYSSGIVEDLSASTSDSHRDSSLYPYPTSSRRPSSDIFNDQQNKDNIFVTENRNSSLHVSSLKNVTEQLGDKSKIEELTPKSEMEDLQDSTVSEEVEVESKPSPGKLKHNLNINVEALLPGATSSKIRSSIAKAAHFHNTVQTLVTSSKEIPPLKADVYLASPTSEIMFKSESQVENYENLGGIEVLHSITKDRAKIPVKRRPSTRRARQEAARKSMTDFSFYTENKYTSEELEQASAKIPHLTENISKRISLVFNKVDISQSNDNTALLDTLKEDSQKSTSTLKNRVTDMNKKSILYESAEPDKRSKNNPPNKNEPLERSQKHFEGTQKANLEENQGQTEVENSSIFNESSVANASNETERNESKKNIGDSIKDDLFKSTSKTKMTLSDEELLKSTDFQSLQPSPAKASGAKYTDIFGDDSPSSDEDLFAKSSKLPQKSGLMSAAAAVESRLPKETQIPSFITESDSDSDLFDGKFPQRQSKTQAKATQKKEKNWIFDDSEGSDDDLFGIKTKNTSSATGTKDVGLKAKRSEIKTANIKKLESTQVTDFDPLMGFK
ncbi:WASH complex subunit 2 isoform X2 [Dendroctonus ponderosae]|uniref:WASH complex subunit 2 isoform X2 n=1 Tax=Dendroctonus ponderosae TaxID=77166 RepID=UPI002035AE4A|nr:WASH complex subunit 2 isoform X2 [Dendroctonus ponderosae]